MALRMALIMVVHVHSRLQPTDRGETTHLKIETVIEMRCLVLTSRLHVNMEGYPD